MSPKMSKLRLSYSLLSCWERNDIDGAIALYFHYDRKSSEAMENGKKVHKEIEEHIKKHNAFPEWFFNYPLKLPETEKQVIVSYNEMFDIKGVFDCYDPVDRTVFEFKTGHSDSLEWARTWQLPIYFLIAEIGKIEADKAILIRNDGKKSDFTIVHNSKKLRDKARNIIDSLAPEIREYFLAQGLL